MASLSNNQRTFTKWILLTIGATSLGCSISALLFAPHWINFFAAAVGLQKNMMFFWFIAATFIIGSLGGSAYLWRPSTIKERPPNADVTEEKYEKDQGSLPNVTSVILNAAASAVIHEQPAYSQSSESENSSTDSTPACLEERATSTDEGESDSAAEDPGSSTWDNTSELDEAEDHLSQNVEGQPMSDEYQDSTLDNSREWLLYQAYQQNRPELADIAWTQLFPENSIPNLKIINPETNVLEPLLFVAARLGHVELLRHLLKHDINLRIEDEYNKNTALHIAAIYGHTKFIDALIEHGALTEDQKSRGQWPINQMGYTPLHMAAMAGKLECLWHLHQYYYLDLLIPTEDRQNNTIFHVLLISNRTEALIGLIQYISQNKLHSNIDINRTNAVQRSVFLLAASFGNLKILQILKELGSDPNQTDNAGRNALHLACINPDIKREVIQFLVGLSISVHHRDYSGKLPIDHLAPNSPHHDYLSSCSGKAATTEEPPIPPRLTPKSASGLLAQISGKAPPLPPRPGQS